MTLSRLQIGQLAQRDFHTLDCGLVAYSPGELLKTTEAMPTHLEVPGAVIDNCSFANGVTHSRRCHLSVPGRGRFSATYKEVTGVISARIVPPTQSDSKIGTT